MVIPRIEEEGLPTRGVVAELQQKQRHSQASPYGFPNSSGRSPSQFETYGNEPAPSHISGNPVVRPPYVNVAYSPETERQYYDQQQDLTYQQHPYGNQNFQVRLELK